MSKPIRQPSLTLDDFCAETNCLDKAECDRINSSGDLFGAEHIPFSAEFLEPYWLQGMTPQEALDEIALQCECDSAVEAMAS